MKKSKRYVAAKSKIDKTVLYDAKDAISTLKKIASDGDSKTKIFQSVDIAINLNLKAKHTVRGAISLPHSTSSKETRVLVFAKSDKAKEAESAGADFVGDADLVEKIMGGWTDFDVAIATPDMMKDISKLGKVLGPRGLMPNPKIGTVTTDIGTAVSEFKRGKVEYRADKTNVVHLKVGNQSMSTDSIFENAKVLFSEIQKKRPTDLKGEYVKSVAFALTMGPGVKVVHQSLS